MKKRVALLFAGQGAQTVGMGSDLAAKYSAVDELFATGDAVVDAPLRRIAFTGPQEELTQTKNCQPALFVHGLGCLAALREEIGDFSVHAAAGDHEAARELLPHLERKAGRILFNGFGTGVEVCHAMVHGGPFPATSDARSTSVGSLAILRFLRPVCYQDVPPELLPLELRDGNPLGVPRRINGRLELGQG